MCNILIVKLPSFPKEFKNEYRGISCHDGDLFKV